MGSGFSGKRISELLSPRRAWSAASNMQVAQVSWIFFEWCVCGHRIFSDSSFPNTQLCSSIIHVSGACSLQDVRLRIDARSLLKACSDYVCIVLSLLSLGRCTAGEMEAPCNAL